MNPRPSVSDSLWGEADDALARQRYGTVPEPIGGGIVQLDPAGWITEINDRVVDRPGGERWLDFTPGGGAAISFTPSPAVDAAGRGGADD
jgi:hypothetical protein